MSEVRRVLVLHGDGLLAASFPGWDEAHAWAHAQATQATRAARRVGSAREVGAPLTLPFPFRVEDLAGRLRRTLEVYPDRCELTVWRVQQRFPYERSTEGCGAPTPTGERRE